MTTREERILDRDADAKRDIHAYNTETWACPCGCSIKLIAYTEEGDALAYVAYDIDQWREIMADIEMKAATMKPPHSHNNLRYTAVN